MNTNGKHVCRKTDKQVLHQVEQLVQYQGQGGARGLLFSLQITLTPCCLSAGDTALPTVKVFCLCTLIHSLKYSIELNTHHLDCVYTWLFQGFFFWGAICKHDFALFMIHLNIHKKWEKKDTSSHSHVPLRFSCRYLVKVRQIWER